MTTALEYSECVRVDQACSMARDIVKACSPVAHRFGGAGGAPVYFLQDKMNWKRYIWALSDQLGYLGLDGVR